jgi:hypothetical protein
MINRDLENSIVQGKQGIAAYREYLDSYTHMFEYLTWKCLNTPLYKVFSLGSTKDLDDTFTLLDAYKNYIAMGKLYEIMSQFWNFGDVHKSPTGNDRFLSDLLKDNGYDLDKLVKDLITKFQDQYIDKIQYTLNQSGSRVKITPLYNTDVYRTIKEGESLTKTNNHKK